MSQRNRATFFQRPPHRIEKIVGNADRITAAELPVEQRGNIGRVRSHDPGEDSSRRDEDAIIGWRQRDSWSH